MKGRFAIAIIAGIIYGLASGFGLPFMTAKVFPLIFSSDQKGITIAVKDKGLKDVYHPITTFEEFPSSNNLYYKVDESSEVLKLPAETTLSVTGELGLEGKITSYHSIYYKDADTALTEVEPDVYLAKKDGKYVKITSDEFKRDDNYLLLAVLMLPLVFLIRGIAGYINTYFITYCGQYVLEKIRGLVFRKFQSLDLAYFQKRGTGDLMTRLMIQTTRLQQMTTVTSNDLIKQPVALLSAIGALVYLAIQSKALIFIVICVVVIPITLIPVRRFSKMMLKRMRSGATGETKLGSCLQENITAVSDIRSFNLEEKEIGKFEGIMASYFKHIMGMTKYRALLPPAVELITAVGISFAIYYSAQYGMKFETVIPLIVALYMSYEPLKKLARLQTQIVMGTVAIEMLDGILHAEEKIKDPEEPKLLPDLKGGITLNKVSFKYDRGPKVLKNVSVKIQPGEIVALVGPSGAGKSTFTHLISRTYELTKGQLYFDENNVIEHRLKDLRAQVAVVSQDPYLFDDTIKNNIRLGKLDATDEEIHSAAEKANCMDFINKLPKKMDMVCGEKATRLSGGQKQRLAIARAFLKDAPILVLDEATSALDAESEQKVQAALAELVKGRTTLIIAHRFSSIKIANRILVFNHGEIVADGAHEDIIESSELYKELYIKQNI